MGEWITGGLITALLVCQPYYWLVYFPRAWRDRSNREINDIRTYVEACRVRRERKS